MHLAQCPAEVRGVFPANTKIHLSGKARKGGLKLSSGAAQSAHQEDDVVVDELAAPDLAVLERQSVDLTKDLSQARVFLLSSA